jgi:NADPH:quinone reductase-like Zn-dependent oxidoreductase
MHALVYDRYGGLDVLRARDVAVPAPGPDEVLVRVRAAALNPKDVLVRKGRFRLLSGWRFPKGVGLDFAGEAVARGSQVRGIDLGQRVYGALQQWSYRRGTLAEYVAVRHGELAPMPGALAFEEAAALPLVSLTALQALRDLAGVRDGDRVCVHGASGGVGMAAVQIARALGAIVVTTSSEANRGLCRSLGASETFDYARGDAFSGAQRFRVIFDAFGDLSFARVRPAIDGRGVYVTTVPSRRIIGDAMRTLVGYPRARLVLVRSRRADLEWISDLVERGVLRPIVDLVVPFDEAARGLRRLETRHARGKIVVRLP